MYPSLALSETWMDFRRVYVNLKGADDYLMARRACEHSFEISWNEY